MGAKSHLPLAATSFCLAAAFISLSVPTWRNSIDHIVTTWLNLFWWFNG